MKETGSYAAMGERIAALEAAAGALVRKLRLVQPVIENAFVMAAVHGARYDGPNYGNELRALERALGERKP